MECGASVGCGASGHQDALPPSTAGGSGWRRRDSHVRARGGGLLLTCLHRAGAPHRPPTWPLTCVPAPSGAQTGPPGIGPGVSPFCENGVHMALTGVRLACLTATSEERLAYGGAPWGLPTTPISPDGNTKTPTGRSSALSNSYGNKRCSLHQARLSLTPECQKCERQMERMTNDLCQIS